DMGTLAGQSLCHDQICGVTTGDQHRFRGIEEFCKAIFQSEIQRMIPRGAARSGNRQSKSSQSRSQRVQNGRMTGQPEVITASEIGEFLAPIEHKGSVDLLETGLLHCYGYVHAK